MKSFNEHIETSDYEYEMFVEALTQIENGVSLNELSMPSFIKKKVEFVKNIAIILKKNFKDMVMSLMEKLGSAKKKLRPSLTLWIILR